MQLIDPGQDATVTFGDLGSVPFASQTTITVDVAARSVRDEHRQQLGAVQRHLLASVG